MFWINKLMAVGLYLSFLVCKTHSFVLLTANVEDLKRIAQKFVSDSLADKIARFVIKAADNNVDFDRLNVTNNLSDYNEGFDVENIDTKHDYLGELRENAENTLKGENRQVKLTTSPVRTKPSAQNVQKEYKKPMKKRKQLKKKSKKSKQILKEESSLEFYRAKKQLNKINPNTLIDLEEIHESDDSSATNLNPTRNDLSNLDSSEKTLEIQEKTDEIHTNIHKYIENDISEANRRRKEASESVSEDFDDDNRLDNKSDEISTTKANVTTRIERNEFDQYFNTYYPKAEVVATSGPVALTKSAKNDLSDTDYK